jgi:hypothetical protein
MVFLPRAYTGADQMARKRWLALLTALCVIPFAGLRGSFAWECESGLAMRRTFEEYSPVAPVRALVLALQVNLRIADEWLAEDDFDSASEAVDRVKLLLAFCELRAVNERWRRAVAELRWQCDQLMTLASAKNATDLRKDLKNMSTSVAALEDLAGEKDTSPIASFKPPGTIKPLMKLLNASHTEAKLAKSMDELSAMSFTIAEAANVLRFLRDESEWYQRADAVKAAAIKVATLKPDIDLKVARQELKNVYESCQACHKAFRQ